MPELLILFLFLGASDASAVDRRLDSCSDLRKQSDTHHLYPILLGWIRVSGSVQWHLFSLVGGTCIGYGSRSEVPPCIRWLLDPLHRPHLGLGSVGSDLRPRPRALCRDRASRRPVLMLRAGIVPPPDGAAVVPRPWLRHRSVGRRGHRFEHRRSTRHGRPRTHCIEHHAEHRRALGRGVCSSTGAAPGSMSRRTSWASGRRTPHATWSELCERRLRPRTGLVAVPLAGSDEPLPATSQTSPRCLHRARRRARGSARGGHLHSSSARLLVATSFMGVTGCAASSIEVWRPSRRGAGGGARGCLQGSGASAASPGAARARGLAGGLHRGVSALLASCSEGASGLRSRRETVHEACVVPHRLLHGCCTRTHRALLDL